MMKKLGVYAALAVMLLISVVLVTNCEDPLNLGDLTPPKGKDQPDFTPSPGMGYITLNFGLNERTIRPDNADWVTNVEDFDHFDILIKTGATQTGGQPMNTTDITRTYSTLGLPYSLSTDNTYTIHVWAHDKAHGTLNNFGGFHIDEAVAYGFVTGEAVYNGWVKPVTITLREITTSMYGLNAWSNGKGTFAWNVALGGRTDQALITLTQYPSNVVVTNFNSKNITTDLVNSAQLDPGFYEVTIVLSGAESQTLTIQEALHIYQGMTSRYGTAETPIALPALNRNVYNVTYTYGDGRYPDGRSWDRENFYEKVTHGSMVPVPTGTITENETDSDFVIEGWYDANITKWNFATPLIKDLNLYAQWINTGISISIVWNRPTGNEPVITIHEMTGNPLAPGPTITPTSISRNNPPILRFQAPAGNYAYSWLVGNTGQTSTDSYIDLDFSLINLKVLGTLRISLITYATSSSGGESASVDIIVNDTP